MRSVIVAAILAASAAGAASAQTCRPAATDLHRLERADEAWRSALADVRRDGRSGELRALGAAARQTALPGRPEPAPGRYLCRTIKLGSPDPRGLSLVAYGWFRCDVTLDAGGDLRLVKRTGSQRQDGQVCPAEGPGPRRAYFLGGLALGTEASAPPYGADADRDVAGWFERIAPRRWRVAFPWPRYESKLDVLELKPVR